MLKSRGLGFLFCLVLLIGSSGCGKSDSSSEGSEANGPIKVAVLASSSQNGYNQAVYEGVQQKAKELSQKQGRQIETTLLDGEFDANTQLSQLQTAGAGGRYQGVIVVPFNGPALGAAFPLGNGIPVVSVLNPIGPDIDKMEPQVEGVVSTIAVPPSDAASKQADGVVEYCKGKKSCKVALMVGSLSAPLDVARAEAYKKVLGSHDNIQIVATMEGNYSRDDSLTAVANMLQATPKVDAILSNADQQTFGAEIALKNAGIEPSSVYLTGGGGTTEAVQAVREGKWQADYLNFPVSMGESAMEQLAAGIDGQQVQAVVDADKLGDLPAHVDKGILKEHPDFKGEWTG